MSVSYKTSDPAALAAFAEFTAKRDALAEQARLIGATFDGKPIFSNSLGDVSFAGLVLNNYQSREDKALWTAPDRQIRVSRPRAGRVTSETKEAQAALRELYISMLPATVRFEPVWDAMGVSWGNLLFSGYRLFELDGAIYFQSSAPVGQVMTEIMGSEFNDAANRLQQRKEVA